MGRILTLTSLALYMTASPVTARSSDAGYLLQPSGPWHLQYVQNECHLQRDFGSGEQAVSLDIAKSAAQGKLDLTLTGGAIPRLPAWLNLLFRLDPQGSSQSLTASSNRIPHGSGRFVAAFDADAAGFAKITSDQTLSFSDGKDLAISLKLLHANEALAALQTCYMDLLRNWNIDPISVPTPNYKEPLQGAGNPGIVIAQRADVKQQPLLPGAWVSWKDYPSDALRAERGGTVVMALSVNAKGSVENCRVVVSSNFQPLDDASCRVMAARASYVPPMSASGDPMPSTAVERIRWVMPL